MLKVKYTKHSREQMIAGGISEYDVEEGINKGVKRLQQPDKIIFTHRYYGIVSKKVDDVYFVITVQLRW
ncbi:DUF4258 domain-containing protein [Candidatus Woesearchaeota archaeon]|nr:DUF4258 domain-containing protein [Candidatus Woesearchaeota archaeon]